MVKSLKNLVFGMSFEVKNKKFILYLKERSGTKAFKVISVPEKDIEKLLPGVEEELKKPIKERDIKINTDYL